MKKVVHTRIGCSGYYNRHWKEIFYPEDLPSKKWFEFYAEHFNTVELNTTFYRFPTAKGLRSWFTKSPPEFIFSVKAPKLITHLKKFNDCEQLINDFYTACEKGLGNKLGCTLFQFPPGMQYSEEKLHQIIENLNPDFKNVTEFRHTSWWNKKVYDELSKKGIIFCSVSHPKLPDTMVINNSTIYLRLHGVPDMFYSNYSNNELKKLRDIILKNKKIKEAYIYFNNTAGTAGVINAQLLKEIM